MKKLNILLAVVLMLMSLAACERSAGSAGADSTEEPEASPPPAADLPSPQATPEAALEADPDNFVLESTVEILIDGDLEYSVVPGDMADIIRSSSEEWMETVFDGAEVEEYKCVRLSLYDVSADESVFCYSMRCEFLPKGGEPTAELMAGNTHEAGEPGWWSFSRQVKVERQGEFWEITSVGTGGVSCKE